MNRKDSNLLILVALACATLFLFGCKSAPDTTTPATLPGSEYLGTWESASSSELITTIRQQGDQFVIHTPQLGGRDTLATYRNGLLQFDDGHFLMYHKDTDTITSSGNSLYLLRRHK